MFASIAPAEKLTDIAAAVLALSDHYIQYPERETPWNEKFCQLAYRYYFMPLNFIRCRHVIGRGQEVGFFQNLRRFVDWGAGPATASLALADSADIRSQILEQIVFDHSAEPLRLFADLHTKLQNPEIRQKLDLQNLNHTAETCLVFSYSLTELAELPAGWNRCEALMILEPSTSQDGRRLMQWREELMQHGYHIWAPCTHSGPCPLLTHSKNDWCHDRAEVAAPDWFQKLEQHLPMKNRTVTVSYLLARKTPPPSALAQKARLTGDSLHEKGKTRQLVCRNDEREFLTWMHKAIEPQTLPRGELIELPTDIVKKANELRLNKPLPV